MKYYRSQAFVNRIQINLAEVSSAPTDEFSLYTAYYDPAGFDCELCDHRNCMYAYEVKNLKTDKILKVGSECIHHFKDKGVDIDLAEGLMKRVMSATNKARRDLQYKLGEEAYNSLSEEDRGPRWNKTEKIRELGKEEYKKLDKEEKRELIVNEFMIVQAKELLLQVSANKYVLSEEETEKIVNLGLSSDLDRARTRQSEAEARKAITAVVDEYCDYLQNLNDKKPDTSYTSYIEQKWEDTHAKYSEAYDLGYRNNPIPGLYNNYIQNLMAKQKYDWLYNYSGKNPVILNIKSTLNHYGHISQKQEEYAKALIEKEANPVDQEFESAIEWLVQNSPNKFINSVNGFYESMGFVSDKQKSAILKLYNKKHKII